jgi:hypothetical protein
VGFGRRNCPSTTSGGHGMGMVFRGCAGSGTLWLVKVISPFLAISKKELCLRDHSMAPFSRCIMSCNMSCDASIVLARAVKMNHQ